MMKFDACPRCKGVVMDYGCPIADGPMCIACGWRPSNVPPEVQAEVEEHLGDPVVKERYIHKHIGKGKPPLSGWEKEKRRRARVNESAPQKPAEDEVSAL